jgi:hypothetical protein
LKYFSSISCLTFNKVFSLVIFLCVTSSHFQDFNPEPTGCEIYAYQSIEFSSQRIFALRVHRFNRFWTEHRSPLTRNISKSVGYEISQREGDSWDQPSCDAFVQSRIMVCRIIQGGCRMAQSNFSQHIGRFGNTNVSIKVLLGKPWNMQFVGIFRYILIGNCSIWK